jgi:hypothetical protein
MKIERDPPRLRALSQELPIELSAALREAPDDNATPGELARLRWRLRTQASQLAAVEPRRRRPRHVGRSPMAAFVLMFAVGAAAGVAASSAVFVATSATSTPSRSASLSVPSAPAPVAVTPLQTRVSEPSPFPDAVEAPEPPPSTTPPRSPPAREPAREVSPRAPLDVLPSSPSSQGSAQREELGLLARAQSALSSDPKTALLLAGEHEARFGHGALSQEREVVAIDALLRLGRRSEASARAMRFSQQFPGSVHARRIEILLSRADHK